MNPMNPPSDFKPVFWQSGSCPDGNCSDPDDLYNDYTNDVNDVNDVSEQDGNEHLFGSEAGSDVPQPFETVKIVGIEDNAKSWGTHPSHDNDELDTLDLSRTIDRDPFIISIEGNIGAGKSTLVKFLKEKLKDFRATKFPKGFGRKDQYLEFVWLDEPVEEWESIQDMDGVTMLEKFYKDKERYSFPFQMMAYISRVAKMKETIESNPGCVYITERCLNTDKEVFSRMLFEAGCIESVEYQIYTKWYDTFAHEYHPAMIVYLKTSPEICFNRIQKRDRGGENSITQDYLVQCGRYHEEMIEKVHETNEYDEDNFPLTFQKTTVITLDGNPDTTLIENEGQPDIWFNQLEHECPFYLQKYLGFTKTNVASKMSLSETIHMNMSMGVRSEKTRSKAYTRHVENKKRRRILGKPEPLAIGILDMKDGIDDN